MTGTPPFYVGVMSAPVTGMTNGPLTTSCSHFVGVRTRPANWTRTVGPPIHYDIGNSCMAVCKKVGSTLTDNGVTFTGGGGGTGGTSPRVSASPDTVRCSFVVEIIKGSPNFTIRANTVQTAAGVVDLNLDNLKLALAMPVYTEALTIIGGGSAGTQATIAVDEATNGTLDSICVAWARQDVSAYISEILFVKLN